MSAWLLKVSAEAHPARAGGDDAPGALVQVEDLAKSYGPIAALRGVTLSVQPGEVVALIGPNGAGKSTLLKALVGLVRPSAGRATVAGHPAGSVQAKAAVGFLPQRIELPENVEVAEVVRFFAGLRVAANPDEAVREALEAVGLAGLERRPVNELSGGMLQRVALAQVLLGNPPVLLLDEPALNLDIEGRQRLRGILEGVRARGGCALVSSHLLDEALQSADRVVILQGGRILADESVAQIRARLESRLHVELDDVPSARAFLAGLGYRVANHSPLGLVVSCSPEQAVRVLHELYDAGFPARGFHTTRMTLEELVTAYLQAQVPQGDGAASMGGGG